MPLTTRLPLLPANACQVSESLAISQEGGRIVLFNAAGPIFSCDAEDRTGLRLAAVTVVEQGLARTGAVAAAFGVHRTTIFRDVRKGPRKNKLNKLTRVLDSIGRRRGHER